MAKLNKMDIVNHDMVWDNILVEAINPPTSSEGLIDPAQYDDKADWGIVLAVGPGRVLENGNLVKPPVVVGDVITFGKYSSYKSRVNGKDYLIIRADDIMSKAR